MRGKSMAIGLILLLIGVLTGEAWAATVHFFDCKECHYEGLTLTELGGANLCLKCHGSPPSITINSSGVPQLPTGGFDAGDASNAMGSNPVPNYQSSHIWAAPSDNVPRAGALPPSRTLHPQFYSRYGASVGRVTCARCHNPHAETSNPLLLVKGDGSADSMCRACHSKWVDEDSRGRLTHPLISDYAAVVAAQPDKYRSAPVNPDYANISLVAGGSPAGSPVPPATGSTSPIPMPAPRTVRTRTSSRAAANCSRGMGRRLRIFRHSANPVTSTQLTATATARASVAWSATAATSSIPPHRTTSCCARPRPPRPSAR